MCLVHVCGEILLFEAFEIEPRFFLHKAEERFVENLEKEIGSSVAVGQVHPAKLEHCEKHHPFFFVQMLGKDREAELFAPLNLFVDNGGEFVE